jgi:hypothetical protein
MEAADAPRILCLPERAPDSPPRASVTIVQIDAVFGWATSVAPLRMGAGPGPRGSRFAPGSVFIFQFNMSSVPF